MWIIVIDPNNLRSMLIIASTILAVESVLAQGNDTEFFVQTSYDMSIGKS